MCLMVCVNEILLFSLRYIPLITYNYCKKVEVCLIRTISRRSNKNSQREVN